MKQLYIKPTLYVYDSEKVKILGYGNSASKLRSKFVFRCISILIVMRYSDLEKHKKGDA